MRRTQALNAKAATIAAAASVVSCLLTAQTASAQNEPWADDPAVQAVLAQREAGIEAMVEGRMSAETERYSTTFVANTPTGRVVPGEALLELFSSGGIGYERVEQHIEYAGSHGDGMVVLMGEETVVPSSGPDAGKAIRRRFTDVFRLEGGEWRHDLRHANVVEGEE